MLKILISICIVTEIKKKKITKMQIYFLYLLFEQLFFSRNIFLNFYEKNRATWGRWGP